MAGISAEDEGGNFTFFFFFFASLLPVAATLKKVTLTFDSTHRHTAVGTAAHFLLPLASPSHLLVRLFLTLDLNISAAPCCPVSQFCYYFNEF